MKILNLIGLYVLAFLLGLLDQLYTSNWARDLIGFITIQVLLVLIYKFMSWNLSDDKPVKRKK